MIDAVSGAELGADSLTPRPTRIELFDALASKAVTGIPVAAPPIDAGPTRSSASRWFELTSPSKSDIAAAKRLARVKSLDELEGSQTDESLSVPKRQLIRLLRVREGVVAKGAWAARTAGGLGSDDEEAA